MRKLTNQKSGFTLIEIIVVLIIVGILAAIALPNLFGNVAKSRGAQALATMSSYKAPLEGCLAANGATTPNVAPCTLGGQNLSTTNGIWTFSIGGVQAQSATKGASVAAAGNFGANSATFTLVADDGSGNTITLTRAASGAWTCSTGTTSPYAGIC